MRKLATAAAVSLILASGSARALILGEIEMRSALNQPMSAEINLTSVAEGELTGMIVKLASPEAFARAGIDRSAVLNDLQFSVTTGSSGRPVISVTSSRPVVEPFLNFLLEVDWTRGRMVREYTVLLDPPVFMSPNSTERRTNTSESTVISQNSALDSTLVPLEIDRSTGVEVDLNDAAFFDESSVVVLDGTGEVSDDLVVSDSLGNSADLGEVVSLDSFNFEEVPGTFVDNGVVTLTDPQVVSLDEIAFSSEDSFNSDAGWNVQVVGDGTEVSDDVGGVLTDSTVAFSNNSGNFSGELVSLDDVGVGSSGASQVTVSRNDTLWEIANRNKVAGMTTQQMMLALLDANSQAFINGNINLVKAGAVLRIPGANEIGNMSQTDAVAQVNTQEKLWREYRDNLRGSRAPTRVASNTATPEPTVAETAPPVTNDPTASADEIAASAEEILNQARNELRIVADNQSATDAASATADPADSTDSAAQLGGLNQQVQLAREELSATRLEGEELTEKSQELGAMTENMDQLVSLQQDQLSQLQAQLAEARKNDAANALTEGAGDQLATAADAVDNTVTSAANIIPESASLVELVPEGTTPTTVISAADPVPLTPAAAPSQGPWYTSFLSDPRKAILAGLGVLGALLLGWLLLRKRKGKVDDEMLDGVHFVDDEDEFGPVADATGAFEPLDETEQPETGFGKVAAAGGAAVAGTAAVAGAAFASSDDSAEEDQTVNLAQEMGTSDEQGANETLSKDDTISEAEVYLAYGLHGQAEDLLTKAIEQSPDNSEYQLKLLQTYHAQGNSESYDRTAEKYHASFGGNSSPSWENVSEMGKEISSSNDLYIGDNQPIANVGAGSLGAPTLNDTDFDSTETIQSEIREFSSDDSQVADMGIDETALLDQSLDPGFAFDESDLEATGDFTQLSEEMKREDAANEDSSGMLSDLTEKVSGAGTGIGDGAKGAVAGLAAGAAGLAGAVGLGGKDDSSSNLGAGMASADDEGVLEFNVDDLQSSASELTDDLTGDLTSAGTGQADAMTMDLEQLSSELESDTTTALDSGMDLTQDLEIPDLTNSIDLTADASAALGNVDEMDTMMDLAKAYIDMGDNDSASSALGEIVKSGNSVQKSEAENLLKKIS